MLPDQENVKDDANAKYINDGLVDRFLLVIHDDFGGHKARSATFSKDHIFLMLEGGQSIVNKFKPLLSIILVERPLVLEKNVLRLDITMHNVFSVQIFESL